MINEIRNTCLAIINKENNGYITPDEFNYFSDVAQKERFEEYFKGLALENQRMLAGVNSNDHTDIARRIEEVIDYFTVPSATLTFNAGLFAIPADRYKLTNVLYSGKVIEPVSQARIALLNNASKQAPSTLFPVYAVTGNSISVSPSTIQSGVTANYVRYPLTPKWTYVMAGEAPLFNPAAVDYQDFELPESDKYDLIVRILQMAGLSIREDQIVAAAKAEELQEKQEQ